MTELNRSEVSGVKYGKRGVNMRGFGLIWSLGWLSLFACGGRVNDHLGGETGFLEACKSDAECKSGLCGCGACTRICTDTQECGDSRAVCVAQVNGEDCSTQGRPVCVAEDESTMTPTSATTSTTTATADGTSAWTSTGDSSEPSTQCQEFACEVELSPTSLGEVEVQVEFSGPFCAPASCGLHLPKVYHVATGLYVPIGRGIDCSECRTFTSTAECQTPTIAGREWNGSVSHPTSTCTSEEGQELSCQAQDQFAPAGKYRAEICSSLAELVDGEVQCLPDLGQRCESIEFDYPVTEPVVLRFNNQPVGAPDAGVRNVDAGEPNAE